MDISFQSRKTLDSKTEFVRHSIVSPGNSRQYYLDINVKELFDRVPFLNNEASDFLFFAGAVYASDKMTVREDHAEDRWTRTINVEIPLIDPKKWDLVKKNWEDCIGFLTGDRWNFTFVQADRRPFERRTNRIKRPLCLLPASTVSLLSGGLDSFAGSIKYLEDHPFEPLIVSSHYDGKVSGPKSDQSNVLRILQQHYPNRLQQVRIRVGVGSHSKADQDFETSFRSRSLVFLAVAFATASTMKNSPSISIPENGAIALNYPLNPSRRGSCSTRTVHPHFLRLLHDCLSQVGLTNAILNPFEYLTKGEVNHTVAATKAFNSGFHLTNSCAKSGHKRTWQDLTAHACGRCVPCLYRRASLHKVGMDSDRYGNNVLLATSNKSSLPDDLSSVIDLIRSNPAKNVIMRGLLSNGSLPLNTLPDYADLVSRMIAEVRHWLSDKAPTSIKRLASIR